MQKSTWFSLKLSRRRSVRGIRVVWNFSVLLSSETSRNLLLLESEEATPLGLGLCRCGQSVSSGSARTWCPLRRLIQHGHPVIHIHVVFGLEQEVGSALRSANRKIQARLRGRGGRRKDEDNIHPRFGHIREACTSSDEYWLDSEDMFLLSVITRYGDGRAS